jgi:hypothetical protein
MGLDASAVAAAENDRQKHFRQPARNLYWVANKI